MHSPAPSPDSSSSLDALLSLFSSSTVASLLESETHALCGMLSDIYQEIHQRKTLESELLSVLEYRELYLDSKKLNLRPYEIPDHARQLDALEKNLITVEQERIHTKQTTARDLLELRKISWHYSLVLHRKASLIRFVR
jgi:hypothetical protein